MQYAQIFISPRPWTNKRVLVGLVAEDPSNGKVQVLRESNWIENSTAPGESEREANDKRQGIALANRFLAALERLADTTNREKGHPTVADILSCIPDRGTACQFSALQSGEFSSLTEALNFCCEREGQRFKSE